MKIEILKLSEIKPYIGNAKQHPDWHIKQIASSIEEFGFNDPIAIDENNTIIEGHGRAMAAELLKLETVPVIKLTHMSEAQRKAYIIAHNKLTMNTDFDLEKLRVEMDELKIMDFDLDWMGFDLKDDITIDYSDLDAENDSLEGMQDFNITVTVPEKYQTVVTEWLANGEPKTAPGIGKGVMKRCGLL